MLDEFKKFIARGNVMDMAVCIVIGAAFTSIVKSVVDNLIMPPIGLLLGTYVPTPGINPDALAQAFQQNSGGILGMFDMFSGGAVGRMAIFALNIMPYISASIIIQLLTTVSPHLEQLKKEGEQGRRQMNQYTRYGTVLLAALQAYGIAVGLEGAGNVVLEPGIFFRITTVITLVGGTIFLMWLGEQITVSRSSSSPASWRGCRTQCSARSSSAAPARCRPG